MVSGVPTPLRLRWRKGRPRSVGLFLIQYNSGDIDIAEVVMEDYVEDEDRSSAGPSKHELHVGQYFSIIIDDCSSELFSEDSDAKHIKRHFGPLRKPPAIKERVVYSND